MKGDIMVFRVDGNGKIPFPDGKPNKVPKQSKKIVIDFGFANKPEQGIENVKPAPMPEPKVNISPAFQDVRPAPMTEPKVNIPPAFQDVQPAPMPEPKVNIPPAFQDVQPAPMPEPNAKGKQKVDKQS